MRLRGGNVLSSYDRRRFNEIVSGLLAEDPSFATRQHTERELPSRPFVALLLWMSMPLLMALGGWTGFLIAMVAGVYGVRLWFRGAGAHRERPVPRHDE
ncbi:hypothetical protein GCM10010435_97110 [Winogradskya consettensis]|uniref:DUF3040 domain-containing protein n=1 Tax=Winogradskya consettensis TaxID=113560 RepID=A0A919W723_9ACTN|nr:DUF3040 domain-containing protein [Actinoplanes consettensis]GIM85332.1 hypothetical protein Aco04nite_95790 [Actinoplanes consettensis]